MPRKVYMLPLFGVPDPEKKPEKKKRGRPEDIGKAEQRAKASVVEEDLIGQVYAYWVEVMRPGRKVVPKLDEARRRKIGWAVYDYGVEECKKAIDGCAASQWHMGRNPSRRRYDDIELIFRNQQKVDMFISLAPDDDFGDF